MNGLTLLLILATLAFALAQRLRLPVIPILLVLGVVAGTVSPAETTDPEIIDSLIDIGLVFLIFFAGLSLNPERFQGQVKAILWVAVVQFLAAAGLGFLVSMAIGFSSVNSLYLGATLGTSSTLVVVRHLQRTAPGAYKRMVIGVVLMQDVAMIFVISYLRHLDDDFALAAKALGALMLIALLAVVLQKKLPALAQRFKLVDEELLLLCALGVLFLFAGAASAFGLSFIVGAFFAGFTLSGFPLSGIVRSVLDSLNSFFFAVFFVALGLRVDVQSIEVVLPSLALVVTLFLITPLVVTFLAERKAHLSARNAITSGLLLSQTSELSVVMALYGEKFGYISGQVVSVIALIAVITMSLSAFLATPRLTTFLFQFHPHHRRMAPGSELSDHALVLGYGSSGDWAIKPILDAEIPLVVVDNDAVVVKQLLDRGITAIRGDGSNDKILAKAGAQQARFILSAMPDREDILDVIEYTPGVPMIARVFEQFDADAVSRAGGIPVLNSLATAETFLEWFDTFSEDDVDSAG